jgi:hypothetical protein
LTRNFISRRPTKSSAILAIAVGGGVAGVADLLQACIQSGWDIVLVIAEGLVGEKAQHGGAAMYALGIFLHFFIAFSAASVYYAASRKLPFMTEYPLVCGLYFGATVKLVMHLIVFPLCAFHATDPLPVGDLLYGLLQKMIIVGLPISYSVWWFAKHPATPRWQEATEV